MPAIRELSLWFWLLELLFPAASAGFLRAGSPKCAFSGLNRRRLRLGYRAASR